MTWVQITRVRAYSGQQSNTVLVPLYYTWLWFIATCSLLASVIEVTIPNGILQKNATSWWVRIKLVKVVLGEWVIEALVVFLASSSAGADSLWRSILLGGLSGLIMGTSFVLTQHDHFGFSMPPVACLGYGVVATSHVAMGRCVGEIFSYAYSGVLVIASVYIFVTPGPIWSSCALPS